MNAVEIDQAVSELFQQPFDAAEFPFQFLAAFDRNETTLKRLRTGNTNRSDVVGGVLQRNHIHIAPASEGEVDATIAALRDSARTASEKARYILATDGAMLHAEDLTSGDVLSCEWADFPNRFGFLLPLAGITTVQAVKESAFDIKATGRLNRLYIELLKDNADWRERRTDMNHFMARLIFCFFAEDTDIFHPSYKFTETVQKMSAPDSSNTHEVIETLFRAMNTPTREGARKAANTPGWADGFPYVNGQLFSGDTTVPRFSKMARSYLLSIGSLNWREINPDIFGSMIQAVADDEERGALGMHYTSVPNILKVLNPLFLDDLRERLDEAGDNGRKLLNLRNRMARIRVFDPACGSGNFLVIAYKEMRKIEAEINKRRGEKERKTDIPLTNFRGIELRDFPAEIARLALIIAEYQCDVLYRGQKEALADFLPLDSENWIVQGNALRLDWLTVCEPIGRGGGKIFADDLYGAPLDQAKVGFENEGGETYICGNPPYLGSTWQSKEQKTDLDRIFGHRTKSWKSLDYVAGWFMKAVDYSQSTRTATAFVATNSICQGQQVPILWPLVFASEQEIVFAHTSFKWTNLASDKAGVTVVIVGLGGKGSTRKKLYETDAQGEQTIRDAEYINAYLVAAPRTEVEQARRPIAAIPQMVRGNMPYDGGGLLLTADEVSELGLSGDEAERLIRKNYGGAEFIRGVERYCLWIDNDDDLKTAMGNPRIASRIEAVKTMRLASPDKGANALAERAHQMREMEIGRHHTVVAAAISSENRPYLPCGLIDNQTTINNKNYAIYDGPLWTLALLASRLHWVWIGTVCVRMRTDFSYSNTLGWNTFPLPKLTEQNKADLTRCAENILLAREAHFPATIADLYDPDAMPENLRRAHEANDEVLERIYIGRRFRNDTERLEHLFARYTEMTQADAAKPKTRKKATVSA